METINEYQKYEENAQDILFEYISYLFRTDARFNHLVSLFCSYAWNAAMETAPDERERINTLTEETYCKVVNYLLKKNRFLVRAVLGTDCYVDMFSNLIPYVRDLA